MLLLGTAAACAIVEVREPEAVLPLRIAVGLAAVAWIVCLWMTRRNSGCPACGRSVIPLSHGREAIRRILAHRYVICPHCGEEVETSE